MDTTDSRDVIKRPTKLDSDWKFIQVKAPSGLKGRLKRRCKMLNIGVSDYVRDAIEEKLADSAGTPPQKESI